MKSSVGVGWLKDGLLGLVAVLCFVASGAGAEEEAREIARRARDQGALNLVGLRAELKLTTTGADGRPREQVLSVASRRVDGKLRSLSRFSRPAGVSGVALLAVERGDGKPADISIYLPKLRRVRKVAQSERGNAFMDTDFSYADLGGALASDDGVKRLADATVDGRAVFVLSGPGVTISVDKETYVPLRAEYFDEGGRRSKLYTVKRLGTFKDRSFAAESVMESARTGSRTTVVVLKLEESSLGDDAFTERALERG